MKLKIDRADLLNGMQIAIRAIPAHTTLPILECVVIEAADGKIILKTYDTELGITSVIDGEIIEEGSTALDAKFFLDIIKKIPAGTITITTGDADAKIVNGKVKFNVSCRNADTFPNMPVLDIYNEINISQFTLKEIIRQTIFSVADITAANKIMTGALFDISGDVLKVITLDGHRISIRKTDLRNSYEPIKAIIPGKTLMDISKILPGGADEDVVMTIEKNNALFSFDNTTVITRLIEGKYFDIQKMLTSEHTTTITLNRRNFTDCIDRATILTKEGDKKPIILETADGAINIRMDSSIGSMNEDLDAIVDGTSLKIGFNPLFFIDALKAIDDEEITLFLSGEKTPCIIKDADVSYLYLLLPVALR